LSWLAAELGGLDLKMEMEIEMEMEYGVESRGSGDLVNSKELREEEKKKRGEEGRAGEWDVGEL
jgi:hypothetical protein